MINLGSIDVDKTYRADRLKYYMGKHSPRNESKPGELLIACTDMTRNADIVGCPIITPSTHEKFLYSMDLAKVKLISEDVLPSYIFMSLRTDWYHKYIKYFASGTNVLHLDINGVMWYPEVVPPLSIQKKFESIFVTSNKKISESLVENIELSNLREWLIPMLMNGQASVQ